MKNNSSSNRREFLRGTLLGMPAAAAFPWSTLWAQDTRTNDIFLNDIAGQGNQQTAPMRVAGVDLTLAADDYTIAGLQRAQQEILAAHGTNHHDLPLAAKADYYEWQLWRYHTTAWKQVHFSTYLAVNQGGKPRTVPGVDSSTWNGALLAAMSHKYAVTHDAETLNHINDLLWGLKLFFQVTGKSGLPARNVMRADGLVLDGQVPYDAPDGTRYFYLGDPAKGTYNQIAAGLAAVMMYVEPDLPAETRTMLSQLRAEFVLHVIDNDYHITGADGKRTTFGDLTPVMAGVGVPFNGQVAFQIVYLGFVFLPDDPVQRQMIAGQYERLRDKEHVYFEQPWKSLVQPQRVAASPFVKGMNDRNHVISAAFTGLLLERFQAARDGRGIDTTFVYRLGQTLYWGMQALESDCNSLCNFMYGALLADDATFAAMCPDRPDLARRQLVGLLDTGVEQLRRFPLDRFHRPGDTSTTRQATGVDARRASDFYWKESAYEVFRATVPINGRTSCGMDFLYAYWLMRHFQLEKTQTLQQRHASVLPT